MINAFHYFKKIPVRTIKIDIDNALEIAWEHKIYSYDAYYLGAALRLNVPLLTFDKKMIKIGKELGINILGGENAGI